MDEKERDELLIRIDERTSRMEKAIFDNGSPGLLTRVARMEGHETRTAGKGAVGGTIMTLVITAVLKQLGWA